MVTSHQLVEDLMTFLEANITDPLSRNKKWIYDDFPRLDLSSYPRIGITEVNTIKRISGLGETTNIETARVNINILVRKGQKLSDGTRDLQILDNLANDVITKINDNHSYFVNKGYLYVKPVSEDFSQLQNHYLKRIQIEAKFVR
ncbi:MAG: hypothetical protein DRG78_20710 [Epsilonproteobacteria bacterium]|nr:MAG: hypothetical protein DRG78_20710 [Campylobacterota bacterium]